MPVRVLIDATAVPSDRGGVGRYVDGLVAALDAQDVALSIVCQPEDEPVFAALAPTSRVIAGPVSISRRPARLAWEQTGLPGLARKLDAEVIHCPHYTMPLRPSRPVVVTLHDATFFSHPSLHTTGKAAFFRNATRLAVRRAARCIVPSQATKDELIRIQRVDGQRIDVASHGVDQQVFHPPSKSAVAALRRRLGIGDGPYIAFLGTLEPRKNVPSLVEAFLRVAGERTGAELTLVLAGGRGWDEQVTSSVDAARLRSRVLTPGYLPIEELSPLLGGAAVVAYPAFGEGFGLPVLEAMACGAPVLTTRLLSLPEVGGEAVAYCTPDADGIAAGLQDLLDDEDKASSLRHLGAARASLFTWQASAERHLAAYRHAVEDR